VSEPSGPGLIVPGKRTVIFVRHADVDRRGDVRLSPPGLRRARLLARMLKDVSLSAVFVTQFLRSVETGTPAAIAAGLETTPYQASEIDSLIATIQAEHTTGALLVVGHSNTVDGIASGLGVQGVGELDADQFDRMFLIIRSIGTTLTRLRYGASTP
jgi:phosphohistidine phosphatase SixA